MACGRDDGAPRHRSLDCLLEAVRRRAGRGLVGLLPIERPASGEGDIRDGYDQDGAPTVRSPGGRLGTRLWTPGTSRIGTNRPRISLSRPPMVSARLSRRSRWPRRRTEWRASSSESEGRGRCQRRLAADKRSNHVHSTRQAARQVQADPRRRGRASAPRVRLRQHLRLRPVPAARRLPQRHPGGLPGRLSRGIPTAASRRSPTCSPARSSTATAWATAAPSPPATSSG